MVATHTQTKGCMHGTRGVLAFDVLRRASVTMLIVMIIVGDHRHGSVALQDAVGVINSLVR
jgi:hypothetical protein